MPRAESSDHASARYDLVVRGARVANATGAVIADVAVSRGQVAGISQRISGRGEQEIDGSGKILAPGGIDPHTHFATPSPDGTLESADDFESGTRAAAAGGVTTIINYAFQSPGEALEATLAREGSKAEGRCHVDYSFHPVVTDFRGGAVLKQLDLLPGAGYPSVKIFTAYEGFRLGDREVLSILLRARSAGVVVNVHAEDDGLTEFLTTSLLAGERPQSGQLRDLCRSRPPAAEAIAIYRTGAYAREACCPVYFVHLSSKAAVDAVKLARRAGAIVYAEVRPAYLFLDAGKYATPDGNAWVCVPPLRPAAENAALWQAMTEGDIDTIGSDHTSYLFGQKLGPYSKFTEIPPGFGSVETELGLMFSHGVQEGRISLEQFVALTSANAAKIFGLWPRKGQIEVGADADFVLIDPQLEGVLGPSPRESRSDYEPFAGLPYRGWPCITVSRGQIVFSDGRVSSSAGMGRWLHRRLAEGRLSDRMLPTFSPGGLPDAC